MQGAPDLPDGRTSILVCSQCGDLGCGAVSAVIAREGSDVVWSDLRIADNLGIDDQSPLLFKKVTSFRFLWDDYVRALAANTLHKLKSTK